MVDFSIPTPLQVFAMVALYNVHVFEGILNVPGTVDD
jgi:hypothetical protein